MRMTTIDPKHFEKLIELLKKKPIEIYRERKNSGVGRSLPFGIINRRNFGLGRSRNNKRYPEHYAEMIKIAEIINPDVKYTSFMLNDNYPSKPHKDKNNDGVSCIVGFGGYEGGELNVEGKKYNIKYIPLHMDASAQEHFTEPWTGSRYSFIMFKIKLKNPVKEKYQDWSFKELNDALGYYDDADSNHKLD
jgi:hypothetical protein